MSDSRYLTIRVLYPRPGRSGQILAAVKRISDEARKYAGLVEIGAWLDSQNERIINLSLWESREQAAAASEKMHALFADIPWSSWERQPAENFLNLTRAV
jgi:hypothetical protein